MFSGLNLYYVLFTSLLSLLTPSFSIFVAWRQIMQHLSIFVISWADILDLILLTNFQEARTYAEENGLFFLETSAKTAANVNDIFYEIGMLFFVGLFCYIHLQIKMHVRVLV